MRTHAAMQSRQLLNQPLGHRDHTWDRYEDTPRSTLLSQRLVPSACQREPFVRTSPTPPSSYDSSLETLTSVYATWLRRASTVTASTSFYDEDDSDEYDEFGIGRAGDLSVRAQPTYRPRYHLTSRVCCQRSVALVSKGVSFTGLHPSLLYQSYRANFSLGFCGAAPRRTRGIIRTGRPDRRRRIDGNVRSR